MTRRDTPNHESHDRPPLPVALLPQGEKEGSRVACATFTVRNGSYPWRKSLIVVLPMKPGALAGRFAAFLRSPAAVLVLQAYDYLPGSQ